MASIKHRFILEGCPLAVLGTIMPSRKPDYLFSLQIGVFDAASFLEADHDKIRWLEAEISSPQPSNIVYLRCWYIPDVVKQAMLHEGLEDCPRFHDEWSREYNRRIEILMDSQEQVMAELDTLKVAVWAGEIKKDDLRKHIQDTFNNRGVILGHHGMLYFLNMNEHGKIKPNRAGSRRKGFRYIKKQVPERRFGTAKFTPEPNSEWVARQETAEALIDMAYSRAHNEHSDDTEEEYEPDESTPSFKRKRHIQDVDSDGDNTGFSFNDNAGRTKRRLIFVDQDGAKDQQTRGSITQMESSIANNIGTPDKISHSSTKSSESQYEPSVDESNSSTRNKKIKAAAKPVDQEVQLQTQQIGCNLKLTTSQFSTPSPQTYEEDHNEDQDRNENQNKTELTKPNPLSPRINSISPLFHPEKIISPTLGVQLGKTFPFLNKITDTSQREEWYHFLSFFSHDSPCFRKALNEWFERHGKGGIRRNAHVLKWLKEKAADIKFVGLLECDKVEMEGGEDGKGDNIVAESERLYSWAD